MSYDDQTEANGKLKPEVKAEWLTLLRSGNVEQAQGTLRRLLDVAADGTKKFGYCCLGVLSNMYVDEKNADKGLFDVVVKWVEDDPNPNLIGSSCMLVTPDGHDNGMPTYDVNDWAFSTGNSNGWYVFIDEADAQKYERYLSSAFANTIYLPQMNDAGASFADIADIIEKYL